MTLKRVYRITRSPYLYSDKNFLSYPMWGFVWPRKGCLSVWPYNPIGHNKDVVFAWGVCDIPHRIGEKVLGAI